jgi:single-stranded DNA-binding protein
LGGKIEYEYTPEFTEITLPEIPEELKYFYGFVRENGSVGVRNDIWIVNTVGCVNKISERLSKLTGAFSFPHPFGCSQLGEDNATTQKILKGLINHANAGGVLVLGLGCENNNIGEMKKVLGEVNENRVKFLTKGTYVIITGTPNSEVNVDRTGKVWLNQYVTASSIDTPSFRKRDEDGASSTTTASAQSTTLDGNLSTYTGSTQTMKSKVVETPEVAVAQSTVGVSPSVGISIDNADDDLPF